MDVQQLPISHRYHMLHMVVCSLECLKLAACLKHAYSWAVLLGKTFPTAANSGLA